FLSWSGWGLILVWKRSGLSGMDVAQVPQNKKKNGKTGFLSLSGWGLILVWKRSGLSRVDVAQVPQNKKKNGK
ncbi:hypothetical protein NDU88_001420, partial [Pleurodeles waltl]